MEAGGSDDVGIENVVIDVKFFVTFRDYSTLVNGRSQRTLRRGTNASRVVYDRNRTCLKLFL